MLHQYFFKTCKISTYTKYEHKLIICKRLFTTFSDEPLKTKSLGSEALNENKTICDKYSVAKAVMIEYEDDEFIYCKNVIQSEWLPIIICVDFECISKPVTDLKNNFTHKHNRAIFFCENIQ